MYACMWVQYRRIPSRSKFRSRSVICLQSSCPSSGYLNVGHCIYTCMYVCVSEAILCMHVLYVWMLYCMSMQNIVSYSLRTLYIHTYIHTYVLMHINLYANECMYVCLNTLILSSYTYTYTCTCTYPSPRMYPNRLLIARVFANSVRNVRNVSGLLDMEISLCMYVRK